MDRVWADRCVLLLNEAPHSSSGHRNGLSPEWIRRCTRKWAGFANFWLQFSWVQQNLAFGETFNWTVPSWRSPIAKIKFNFQSFMAGSSPCKAALARFSHVNMSAKAIKARTLVSGDLHRLIRGDFCSLHGGQGHSDAWAYKPSGMNHNHGKKNISQLFRLSRFAVTQKCHRKNLKRLGLQ